MHCHLACKNMSIFNGLIAVIFNVLFYFPFLGCSMMIGTDGKNVYMAHIQPGGNISGTENRFSLGENMMARGSFANVNLDRRITIAPENYTSDVSGFPNYGDCCWCTYSINQMTTSTYPLLPPHSICHQSVSYFIHRNTSHINVVLHW